MSHFYGTLETSKQGSKRSTRCGTKNETMFATIATADGAICLRVTHDEETGTDRYTLEHETHRGHGTSGMIVRGTIGGPDTEQGGE